ncbi:hypothetical protein ACE10Z_34765 [Bradyrhizobium sp. Pha-3]
MFIAVNEGVFVNDQQRSDKPGDIHLSQVHTPPLKNIPLPFEF